MPTARHLWLGPYSADLAGMAVDRYGDQDDGLWIVPTPLARDGLIVALARCRKARERPGVFCWDDFWLEVARRHARPPALLSEASARAVVIQAIERSRADGDLGVLAVVADLAGFRRDLRTRFDAWTLAERPAPTLDEVDRAAWSIYRRYRTILGERQAEDAPGLAVWASRKLADGVLGRPGFIAILDPVAPSKTHLRAIEWATLATKTLLITLPQVVDPDDMAVAPLQIQLEETEFLTAEFEPSRPTSLAALEQALFDAEAPVGPTPELSILGGPKGEGLGLILAREVARRIEEGISPDEILVLVPRWDDDTTRATEILTSWGLPTSGGAEKALASVPAVAALRLALSVGVGGWEREPLLRLLRNGQIAPDWADGDTRAKAASTIESLRVFRGLDSMKDALDRPEKDKTKASRAALSRVVLDRLATALDRGARLATWPEHARWLQDLARQLGLGQTPSDRASLDPLWDALDDHMVVRDDPNKPIDLDEFATALDSLTNELCVPRPGWRPGTVRFATVADAHGASAKVILLTNLAEGTFPSRASVAAGRREQDAEAIPLAYSRERLAFRRVLGSADQVVLLVPTTDEKGQELLPAGFVDDVRRRLGGAEKYEDIKRLDPTFRDQPGLARSPGDARVLALARACLDHDRGPLRTIAHDPSHRRSLAGTSAGLRLIHERFRIKRFTRFDGLLTDPKLVARIAQDFGPDHSFSPSQFESFALCPFQFFQRYVLKLTPIDDRPELRVDFANRGILLHEMLEEIHAAIASEGPDVELLERIESFVRHQTEIGFSEEHDEPGDVAGGLGAIESEDVLKALVKYTREFKDYRDGVGSDARPDLFEWKFGLEQEKEEGVPALELGDSDQKVRLRGSIDRVDQVLTNTGPAFRVIDYKTGHTPTASDVTKHLRFVQLPLYAMAVEQLHFHGEPPAGGCDFGYWSIGRRGFRHFKFQGKAWPEFRERVVAEVLRLAALLRHGVFPVEPKTKDCSRMCDYKTVCRIGQLRRVEKEPLTLRDS